jgi:hypothetical protein
LDEGMESMMTILLNDRYEHKADSVPPKRLQGQDVLPIQAVTSNVMKSLRREIGVEILAQDPERSRQRASASAHSATDPTEPGGTTAETRRQTAPSSSHGLHAETRGAVSSKRLSIPGWIFP